MGRYWEGLERIEALNDTDWYCQSPSGLGRAGGWQYSNREFGKSEARTCSGIFPSTSRDVRRVQQ